MPISRRRSILLVLLVVALVAGTAYSRLYRGSSDLIRYQETLAASGETLLLQSLAPRYSSEASEYHNRLESLIGQLGSPAINPALLNLMERTSGGYGVANWRQTMPVMGKGGGSWESFAKEMSDDEPILFQIREMLRNLPSGSAYDWNSPWGSRSRFDWVKRRRLAQRLSGAVSVHLHFGQLDGALTNLHSLIAVSRLHDAGGLLIDRMIQVAIVRLGLAATWEALQAPGWDDARLSRLQAAWQQINLVDGLVGTVERERAWGFAFYEMSRTNAAALAARRSNGPGSPNLTSALEDSVMAPVWRRWWAEGDELLYLKCMQILLSSGRIAATNNSYLPLKAGYDAAMAEMDGRTSLLDRFRFQAVRVMLPNWGKAAHSTFTTEAARHLALAAIAIRRHELKYRELPVSLGGLVPEFIDSVPRDVLSGSIPQYERTSSNRFRVFSTGENGKPENGEGDDVPWLEALRTQDEAGMKTQ